MNKTEQQHGNSTFATIKCAKWVPFVTQVRIKQRKVRDGLCLSYVMPKIQWAFSTAHTATRPLENFTFNILIDMFKKTKVSHSLIAAGTVGVRVPLYRGHSWRKAGRSFWWLCWTIITLHSDWPMYREFMMLAKFLCCVLWQQFRKISLSTWRGRRLRRQKFVKTFLPIHIDICHFWVRINR